MAPSREQPHRRWLLLCTAFAAAATAQAAWSAEGLPTTVPSGYERLEDTSDVRSAVAKAAGTGRKSITTVMFTMDGGVHVKKTTNSRRLPRSLAEIDAIHPHQSTAAANPNPDLACQGCPSNDIRTEVTDTTVAPYDAIGMLAREQQQALSDTIAQCTGTLIGARRQHVLTAGHCLVDNTNNGTAYDKITFYPGISGTTLPFGAINANNVRVLQQYVDEQGVTPLALNYDFGLITLANPAPVGTTTMQIAAGIGSDVTYNLQTAGYPADKPAQTMWQVGCPNVMFNYNGAVLPNCGSSCSNIVVHDCLSSGGQSGSAIWSTNGTTGGNPNVTIRAVLTGALTLTDGTTLNTATELNSFIYNTIAGWYNEDITNGLPLAPPAPPGTDNTGSSSNFFSNNGSWFHNKWWYIFVPIIVVFILVSLIGGCLARGRRAKPIAAPVSSAYAGSTAYPVSPNSNYGQYGPAYYNGYGSSGQTAYPSSYPQTNGYSNGYPQTGSYAPSGPYQTGQYPTTYPTR